MPFLDTTAQPVGRHVASDVRLAVREEQVRLLYGHAAGIYGGTLGCALVAVLLLWQEVARDPLLLWGGYAFVLTAGRLYFLSRYRRAAPTGRSEEHTSELQSP